MLQCIYSKSINKTVSYVYGKHVKSVSKLCKIGKQLSTYTVIWFCNLYYCCTLYVYVIILIKLNYLHSSF